MLERRDGVEEDTRMETLLAGMGKSCCLPASSTRGLRPEVREAVCVFSQGSQVGDIDTG